MRLLAFIAMIAFLAASTYAAVPQGYVLIKNESIAVPAYVEEYDTGIRVNSDDYLEIHAYGRWRYDPRPQFETGPNGITNYPEYSQFSPGSLIGKIDNNSAFLIGEYWEGFADYAGNLFLGMYDKTQYENNIGELNVSVAVYGKESSEKENVDENESGSKQNAVNKTYENGNTGSDEKQKICIALIVVLGMGGFLIFLNKSLG